MNILFVCTGNLYRSKVGEVVAKESVKLKTGWNIDSAGIGASHYGKISPLKLRKHMEALGYNSVFAQGKEQQVLLRESKVVTKDMLKKFNIIVYMQNNHRKQLQVLLDEMKLKRKLVFLGDYFNEEVTRVPDPAFISNDKEFRKVIVQIISATKKLMKEYV